MLTLTHSGAPHASLEALIAWNKAHAEQVMPFFGQELFEQAQAKGPLTDAAYLKARDDAKRLAGKDGLLATLETRQARRVDCAERVAGMADRPRARRSLRRRGLRMAAVAGTPSLTVPIGDAAACRSGLTFMGRPFSRGRPAGLGLRLRAGDESEKTAGLQALPR